MKFQSKYMRISHWRNANCRPIATTSGHPLVLLPHRLHHHEKRDTCFSYHCMRTPQTECRAAMWSFCIAWHKVLLCYCVPRVMVRWERWAPNEVEATCIIMGCIYFFIDWQFQFWHNQCWLHEVKRWTVIRKDVFLHKTMKVPTIPNSFFIAVIYKYLFIKSCDKD
jgi:hypothetical protein